MIRKSVQASAEAYPMRKEEGAKEGAYPLDHIHQKSLWFTHGSVNGFSRRL